MLLSYVYKLRPNSHQSDQMNNWLDMLRSHYNWCLADRINTYNQQFIQGNYCDIRTKAEACPLTCFVLKNGATGEPWKKDGTKRSARLIQDAALPELKKARPWYAEIDSDVLQANVSRLNTAYQNFFSHGKGFPKFRNRSNFRSFEYKPKRVKLEGNRVYLPGIGWMRFFNSRPIPPGFSIRTVTIRQKASGWFMSVRIEDKLVPDFPVMSLSEVKTAVGLDLGLTKLVHFSDGSDIENPRVATNKKMKRTMKIRQRRLSRKKKGGKNRKKEAAQVAKLHQKIKDRRDANQWKIASRVVKKADAIIAEDLNVAGMVKRCKVKKDDAGRFLTNGQSRKKGLNRAIHDAGWSDLIAKIEYTAVKSGKVFILVNPKNTSTECSVCHHIDAASRDREKFICTVCGHLEHADKQAAKNIKVRGIESRNLTIKKVRKDEAKPPVQLDLGLVVQSTPTPELTGGKRRKQSARKGKRAVPGNLAGEQLKLFDQDILGGSCSA